MYSLLGAVDELVLVRPLVTSLNSLIFPQDFRVLIKLLQIKIITVKQENIGKGENKNDGTGWWKSTH